MKENRLFWISALITAVIAAAAFGIYYAAAPRREEAADNEAVTEQKLLLEKKLSEMVKKYNAVADWDAKLKSREAEGKPIYTVEIQEALLEAEDRPILFYAFLSDIERGWVEYTANIERRDPAAEMLRLLGIKKREGLIAHFESFTPPEISFELECSPEQVNKLLEQPDKISENNYAVIAQVKDVYKPPATLNKGRREVERDEGIVARGVCVDFLQTGRFYWEFVH